MLYVSYGGFPKGIGHLLEFSLYRQKVVYDRGYRFGIDSFDISHGGRLIFMPTGENTSGDTWHVLAAGTGRVVGLIAAGRSPHDTVVDTSGRHVFLRGASDLHLYEADVDRPWKVIARIGPLEPGGIGGVRPFTIDAQDTLAFTTADRYLGFQVSDVASGRVLYKVPVPGFGVPATFRGIPSHGIGLSPDQRYLWLVDRPNRAVHEFDVSGLPQRAPVMIATVGVAGPNLGWLNLSRDGRYLFAGRAGNVIDTHTRTTVARMGALVDSRYNIEIDWVGTRVCAAYPRESLGYLHVASECGAPAG
jgi:hypothetical protein